LLLKEQAKSLIKLTLTIAKNSCKKGGGIVGITKTSTALSRWALSYNLRLHMAIETKVLYGVSKNMILSRMNL